MLSDLASSRYLYCAAFGASSLLALSGEFFPAGGLLAEFEGGGAHWGNPVERAAKRRKKRKNGEPH